MTSSSREVKKKYPSASTFPISAVRYQASSVVKRSAVRSGASTYPVNHINGLSVASAICPSTTAARNPGSARPIEPGRTGARTSSCQPLTITIPCSVCP